jgi:hypothetical protein
MATPATTPVPGWPRGAVGRQRRNSVGGYIIAKGGLFRRLFAEMDERQPVLPRRDREEADDAGSSSSGMASPISRNRRFGSFSRHRASRRRIFSGTLSQIRFLRQNRSQRIRNRRPVEQLLPGHHPTARRRRPGYRPACPFSVRAPAAACLAPSTLRPCRPCREGRRSRKVRGAWKRERPLLLAVVTLQLFQLTLDH